MRFKLVLSKKYVRDPAIDSLPALTTARKIYKPKKLYSGYYKEFVAKSDEVIPSCD